MVDAQTYAALAEQKMGQIRSIKLQILDEKIAQENNKLRAEQVKTQTSRLDIDIAYEKQKQKQHKLTAERTRTQIAALEPQLATAQLSAAYQAYGYELQALQADVGMARLKAEMKQAKLHDARAAAMIEGV